MAEGNKPTVESADKDFPEPDSPINATNSPLWILIFMSELTF